MNTTAANSVGSLNALGASINNPKSLTLSPAVNGFVVSTTRVETYGADMHVAKDQDEVMEIIKNYFAS